MPCNKLANQKFKKEFTIKPKQKPDFKKHRFTIKMLEGTKFVYMSTQSLKEGVNVVKVIKKVPHAWRSWFIMDDRTKTIRHFTQRHLALSSNRSRNHQGGQVVLQAYSKGNKTQ